MSQKKRKSASAGVYVVNYPLRCDVLIIFLIITICAVASTEDATKKSTSQQYYDPIVYDENEFVPMIPTHSINNNNNNNNYRKVENNFFKNGAFKIFNDEQTEHIEDSKTAADNVNKMLARANKVEEKSSSLTAQEIHDNYVKKQTNSLNELQKMILKYVDETLNKRTYEIMSGLNIEFDKNYARDAIKNQTELFFKNHERSIAYPSFDAKLMERLWQFAESHVINVDIPRAMHSTGRLFFFKGLKKFMWPVFIGLQVVKTVLLAMFLPSIIGSLGKIVGKGLSSVSGFAHPAETVDDLEFKDNVYMPQEQQQQQVDKYNDYSYPQGESGKNNFANQMYDAATANNALSRFGEMGQAYLPADYSTSMNTMNSMNAMNVINSMNYGMATSKKDDFKIFHDIPLSSMLLTNYDPFYSPLLSRLDAVFQQMGLTAGNEKCREKLVCLMYSSPAKYAPYSNLISAQLSRELNELKKPTSDNPDILRFFKYMRAAKDGQDHANCDLNFKECSSLNSSDSPAMITTYNDINKLVQARKL